MPAGAGARGGRGAPARATPGAGRRRLGGAAGRAGGAACAVRDPRSLRTGGGIGMVEFGVPAPGLLRALWRVHTRVGLPLLGRLVSPAWLEVGRFLGPNIEEFHARFRDLPGLWHRAGIDHVRARSMSFGAGLVMW